MKQGDRGLNVRRLQQQLNELDDADSLIADGIFGPKTAQAVSAFQQQVGLVALGVAGPRTLRALRGTLDNKYLSVNDLRQAAQQLHISLATLIAVAEVESSGAGFFESGQPTLLFERHIFFRRLNQQQPKLHSVATRKPNIYAPTPGAYAGGQSEYQRLEQARAIAPSIANESASWGMFQIMGFHWQPLGYSSVDEFVQQQMRSEAAQLATLVRFIKQDKRLLKALQQHDWAAFAKRYNGPNYQRNLYDSKLAQAFVLSQQAYPDQSS